jgi:hypothetical protein
MPAQPDDWRRMGQEHSLIPGTRFAWKSYQAPRADWDHDHCSMCQDKFMVPADSNAAESVSTQRDVLTAGYATTASFARGEGYEWVCATCYEDFAEEFRWESEAPGRPPESAVPVRR